MNIAEHVERVAKKSPAHSAIIFEGNSVSYRTLNACAAALARTLARHGVKRGDRVALYLPNIPAFALCYLAVERLGAVAVSINSMFKSEEVRYIVNDSGAEVVFSVGELLDNLPRNDCPSVRHVVNCEGVADETTLGEWISAGEDDPYPVARLKQGDPSSLLYSSRTTGFPKGVTLTHGNVVTNIRSAAKYSDYRPADRLSVFLPLFHVFAQNYIMNAGFEAGSTLVLWRRFVPDVVLPDIRRLGVSMFFGVPTIYISLLNAELPAEALSSVRYFFSAAATMPEEISRRWTEVHGRRVYEGYGLTECSPFAAYNHLSRHKYGSVGTAIEDSEVKIFDENDREVAPGEWGEIVIRGPGVMKGYWNRPEDTSLALRSGWLHSGDIGRMDEEGYIYIVDRVKDMINVSGFKVWPAEVENVIYRHPAVREVAVYGVPDPLKGEKVRVAVVLKDAAGASEDEIVAHCRDLLAAYKAPERVDFVRDLPKSATGKILKRLLREQATKEQP